MVNRVFSPRRVRELVPHIEDVVHQLIDAFAARGECEFFKEFAHPLPGTVIAEQLGLDRSQIGTFKRWGDAMLAPASCLLTEAEAGRLRVDLELEAQHHFAAVFEAPPDRSARRHHVGSSCTCTRRSTARNRSP